jgi:Pyridoxamine 5'-phosphate oxidase
MDDALKSKILELLDQHRLMTIATNRPDGWPQATTVGYVNDGLTIYFLCTPQSQKAANLARDNRVSLTIDHDVNDPIAITGLSMAALAQPGAARPSSTRWSAILSCARSLAKSQRSARLCQDNRWFGSETTGRLARWLKSRTAATAFRR